MHPSEVMRDVVAKRIVTGASTPEGGIERKKR